MSDNSKISWTSATWNPVTGCDSVSPGCDHCYARTLAERFRDTPGHYFERGFDVVLRPDKLGEPFRWRKPRRIFVNSMSDLFHSGVPDGFIAQVWDTMGQNQHHTFQLLTKRHGRMRSWIRRWADMVGDSDVPGVHGLPPMPRGPEAVRTTYRSGRGVLFADMLESMGTPPPDCAYPTYDWIDGQRWWPSVLPNVWVGVSVEDQQRADLRTSALRETQAVVRMLSCEPLLGPIEADLTGIGWVIVGGESGPGARPMRAEWALALHEQCKAAGVPFFFKQTGSVLARRLGIKSKGEGFDALPAEFQVREYPPVADVSTPAASTRGGTR